MNLIDHEVLVVVGGLAGIRAAIEIKKAGFDVAILSRVHPLKIPFRCSPRGDKRSPWKCIHQNKGFLGKSCLRYH